MRWLVFLALSLLAAPALAQTELPSRANRAFEHERTGIAFPPAIGEARRTSVVDFGQSQFDVMAQYVGPDEQTLTTIYVYRRGVGDVSTNFDMVISSIELREGYTPTDGAKLRPRSFTPAGHARADALQVTFDVRSGGPFSTGGAALIPHGDWLIKVRVSSNLHDTESLHSLIDHAAAALALPAPEYQASAAGPIAACTAPLQTSTNVQSEDAGIEKLLGYSMSMEALGSPAEAPQPWCRDLQYRNQFVYRPGSRDDGFILALNDAGHGLSIGLLPDAMAELTGTATGYVPVAHANADRTILFALLSGLPDPGTVNALLDGASPLIASDRDGQVTVYVETGGDT